MTKPDNRLLLLVQTHAHVAALHDCIPHIRANYGWAWVVYSPAVLADPNVVEREFDQQIKDLSDAAKACYAREDGAGGDQYKSKRDAAILEKSAKVKDAWKGLPEDQKKEAVNRLFKPFFDALNDAGVSAAITQAQDHFETAAHVEFQNALKASMRYQPGDYMIGWPTSLPKSTLVVSAGADQNPATLTPLTPEQVVIAKKIAAVATPIVEPAPAPKRKGRPPMDARLKELMQMSLDDLGPIAFELGVKHNDPVMGNRMKLVHHVFALETAKAADVSAY